MEPCNNSRGGEAGSFLSDCQSLCLFALAAGAAFLAPTPTEALPCSVAVCGLRSLTALSMSYVCLCPLQLIQNVNIHFT